MVEQRGITGEGEMESCRSRTVVVGVKLDAHSRELLTWALVKVAQPGDTVVALHVLGNNGECGTMEFFTFGFVFFVGFSD